MIFLESWIGFVLALSVMVNAETLEVGGKTESFLTYSESLVFGNCDHGRWPNCLWLGNWEANLYTDDMQMPFVEILI